MTLSLTFRAACVIAGITLAGLSHAESFVSSASSAGSESSGSVSDSLHGSSRSSRGNDRRADADYRIIDVAAAPGRAGLARLTLATDDALDTLTLDLPEAIATREALAPGVLVHARGQVYGIEFAHADTRAAFFLVLDDEWFDGLAARPVKP